MVLDGEKKVAIKACGYRGYLHVTSKNMVFRETYFKLMVHVLSYKTDEDFAVLQVVLFI